jgi:hypothetical protein
MNPIPIEKMPDNIHKLLTKKDYMYAILHPFGFQKGIFDVIHLNKEYPQWNNIIMNANDGTDLNLVVYTTKGWAVKPMTYIWDQLILEYVLCFDYMEKNKEKFWPGICEYDDDTENDAELAKIFAQPNLTPEDIALTAVADMIVQSIRRNI